MSKMFYIERTTSPFLLYKFSELNDKYVDIDLNLLYGHY